MKKKNNKGFTLVEIIAVLAIMAIIAAVAIPSYIGYVNAGKEKRNANIASSIFLYVQDELTNMRSRGQLSELAEFSAVSADSFALSGGYLSESGGNKGKLPAELCEAEKEAAEFMYYLMLTPASADPFLKKLIDGMPHEVTSGVVCIEFNAATGNVKSAFYSDVFDSFEYSSDTKKNDIIHNRRTTTEMGVYSVDTTGVPVYDFTSLKVNLVDSKYNSLFANLTNSLYAEIFVPESDTEYEIQLIDESGNPIAGTSAKFTYSDKSSLTSNNMLDAGKADPTGGAMATHNRIYWVLDSIPEFAASSDTYNFSQSIAFKYPAVGIGQIKAKLTDTSDRSKNAESDVAHSYFASQDGDNYFIENLRHFNNVRYALTMKKNFRQMADIDLADYANFAPLTWIPESPVAVDTSGELVTQYIARKSEIDNHKIENLTIHAYGDADSVGLFGVISGNGGVTGLTLTNARITAEKAANAGAVAGKLEGSAIVQLCAVLADVNVNGQSSAAASVNIGGLVGLLDGSAEIRTSYMGGYTDPANNAGSGYVRVGGTTAYTVEVNVGGIAGAAASGAKISRSYNNARVNVDAVTFNADNLNESAEPVYTANFDITDLANASFGGIVGRNYGAISDSYATNFVAEYGSAPKSNSGALAGYNDGTLEGATTALDNGLSLSGAGSAAGGSGVTREELHETSALNGNIWERLAGFDPDAAANLAYGGYPFPKLVNNSHTTAWESIKIEDAGGVAVFFIDSDNSETDTNLHNALYLDIYLAKPDSGKEEEYTLNLLSRDGNTIHFTKAFKYSTLTEGDFVIKDSKEYMLDSSGNFVDAPTTPSEDDIIYNKLTLILDRFDSNKIGEAYTYPSSIALRNAVGSGDFFAAADASNVIPKDFIKASVHLSKNAKTPAVSEIQHSYFAASDDAENAENNKYRIANLRHFNNVRYAVYHPAGDAVNKKVGFVQTGDIDLSGEENFAPLNWVPAVNTSGEFAADGVVLTGTDVKTGVLDFTKSYTSEIDGGGNAIIKGLTIEPEAVSANIGLFGSIGTGGSVSGITLEGARIAVTDAVKAERVGALAGQINGGTITGIVLDDVAVSADTVTNLGGLAGDVNDSTITGSVLTRVAVNGVKTDNIGGLAGSVRTTTKTTVIDTSTISANVTANGTVNTAGTLHAGIVVGRMQGSSTISAVNSVYADSYGKLSVSGSYGSLANIGGIVGGMEQSSSVSGCKMGTAVEVNISTTALTSQTNVGGIAGSAKNTATIKSSHVSFAGNLGGAIIVRGSYTTALSTGGVIGYLTDTATVSNSSSFANIVLGASGATNAVNVGGIAGTMKGTGKITGSYNGGYSDPENGGGIGEIVITGAYSGDVNAGGIVGWVDNPNASVERSYNNARINVDSVTYLADTYESKTPVFTGGFIMANYSKGSFGGIAGKNRGKLTECYTTSFVAQYTGTSGDMTNSAAMIGNNLNDGVCKSLYALHNGLYAVKGKDSAEAMLIAKDELSEAVKYAAANWSKREFKQDDVDLTPASYQYPQIVGNAHTTRWENIEIPLTPNMFIKLIDSANGGAIPNSLYCEVYVENEHENFIVDFLDELKKPISSSSNASVTFMTSAITASTLADALAGDGIFLDPQKYDIVSDDAVQTADGTYRRVVILLDRVDVPSSDGLYKYPNGIKFKLEVDSNISFRAYVHSDITNPLDSKVSNAEYTYFADESVDVDTGIATASITSARHLNNIRYFLDKPYKYQQTADIVMLDVDNFAPISVFPTFDGMSFKMNAGEFKTSYTARDGSKNFKISSLKMNPSPANGGMHHVGLFGSVNAATIEGISITGNSYITATADNVGAIAGLVSGGANIKNSTVYAAVNANANGGAVNLGGLVGYLSGSSTLENSFNSGYFINTPAEGSDTIGVYLKGTVTSEVAVGGLIGRISEGSSLINSYNNARVNVSQVDTVLKPNYSALPVSTALDNNPSLSNLNFGGLAGVNRGAVKSCYTTGFVGEYFDDYGESNTGAAIGMNYAEAVLDKVYALDFDRWLTNGTADSQTNTAAVTKAALIANKSLGTPWSNPGSGSSYPYPVLTANPRDAINAPNWEDIYNTVEHKIEGDLYFSDSVMGYRQPAAPFIFDGKTSPFSSGIPSAFDNLHLNFARVNLKDETAPNHISKLRFNINYTGISPLFARVKLYYFIYDTVKNTYAPITLDFLKIDMTPQPLFTKYHPAWLNDYYNDAYFYRSSKLRPNGETTVFTPLIKGLTADYDIAASEYANCEIFVSMKVEYTTMAGINADWNTLSFPWK